MARHIRWALAALFTVGLAADPAAAVHGRAQSEPESQQHSGRKDGRDDRRDDRGHNRRIWWKDADLKAAIGLTEDQAAEIDRIFKAEIDRATPIRKQLNRLEKALNEMLKDGTADVAVVTQQVEKVESLRAELNKIRVVMLYRIHRVLSPEQNAKWREYFDRREADRKKDGDRRR